MFVKLRPNLYLGDKDACMSEEWTKVENVTSIVVVADDLFTAPTPPNHEPRIWTLGLRADRMNPPHVKDLAAHVPKYLMQNGEVVLIQSVTGLQRGAYIACRVLCEMENKTIYEVMQELKELVPAFDINKGYF